MMSEQAGNERRRTGRLLDWIIEEGSLTWPHRSLT
jgi:hypothetical protein